MKTPYLNEKPDELQPVLSAIVSSPLQKLVEKAQLLLKLNVFVQNWLPEDFRPHCRVMNLDYQTLVLGADNAALATRIQFMSPDLLKLLKKEMNLPIVVSIRCRVRV